MKVALFLFVLTMTRAQDTTYNCNGWSQFKLGVIYLRIMYGARVTSLISPSVSIGLDQVMIYILAGIGIGPLATRMSRRTRK
ncbi:MAG: hypothetical protein CM1200mP10_03710 [Candidatus Neomarinimicrobiota bacterium]|nr:MAG: hypothetical protein CM1200mP10_03710 [Candidatus Neomarinimicrobiota bacterium]